MKLSPVNYSVWSLSLMTFISGCATENASGRHLAADTANTYACADMGNNSIDQVVVDGDKIQFINSGNVQTGTKQISTDPSQTSYSGFSPEGFIGASDTLNVAQALLTTGTGVIDWLLENSNIHWPGSCHLWSAADTRLVSCAPQIEQYRPVDSTMKSVVKQIKADSLYELRIPGPESGGDYVYQMRATMKGVFCNLASRIVPISCPAIIADRVSARARKDGSSSGEPFVQLVSRNSYVSGIHDAESGEFIYNVSVEADGGGSKVTSITVKK